MRGVVVLLVLVVVGCASPKVLEAPPPTDAVRRPPAASLRILGVGVEAVPQVMKAMQLTIETNDESGEWRLVREKTGQSSRSMQTTKAAQIVFEGDGETFVAAIDCQDPTTSTKGRLFIFDQDLNVGRVLSIAPHYFVGIERTPTSLRAIALTREDSACGVEVVKLEKPLLVEIDRLERFLFDHHRLRKNDKQLIFVE